jgi:glycogen debranching enzyme
VVTRERELKRFRVTPQEASGGDLAEICTACCASTKMGTGNLPGLQAEQMNRAARYAEVGVQARIGLRGIAIWFRLACLCVALTALAVCAAAAEQEVQPLELSRPVRHFEFLPVVGTRAALLGNESGRMEAWVYPLKLLRDFHLQFHVDGRVLPAETLARTISVRPESSTITYANDTFTVRETLFVPVNEPGAIISLDVETEQPLEITASFVRDFQLEWPAAMGGTYMSWDAKLHAFALGEETKKFAGLVGSPTALQTREEYQTNYSESSVSAFRLGVTNKGKDTKIIALAGSVNGAVEVEATFQRLLAEFSQLLHASAEYYENYLRQTVSVEMPDAQLQQAYDWSRISIVQGVVSNPYLGTALVAGYRTSGESARPGFAWFFGRDSLWTSLALNAAGDFANTKTALEFVSKFQRDDGKIPHEISQTASLVPWFKNFPYGYASADATPLYIIATNDYVQESGDVAFAKEKWDSLWKAYQFLRSTYDTEGLPQNFGIGHGWVEGGPLLPVKTELYQSGLGAEALRALSNLARLTGKDDASKHLAQEFEHQKSLVEKAFWITEKGRYALALDKNDKPVDETSVLATVPMWFGLLDQKNAGEMIAQLADSDQQTDWGMRIISNRSAKFSGGGYHFGSVWPLFTGWAAVGEYRYHHALAAYENLRANALLALDGSLGHVTEVLSGDYYQPLSTSSPHQIWSAAMVVNPVLRGMFGLSENAETGTLTFAPHTPSDWSAFSIRALHSGSSVVDLHYIRTPDAITLKVDCKGGRTCPIEFAPALSLRAVVTGAEVNGQKLEFHAAPTDQDQHVSVKYSAPTGTSTLRIRVQNDFGVEYDVELPQLGARSQGLRMLSETWTAQRDALTLDVAGKGGAVYELKVWNPSQAATVEGGELLGAENGLATVRVRFPPDASSEYRRGKIIFHFSGKQGTKSKRERPVA